MFDNFGKKTEPYMYFIFRVLIGVLYAFHGMQKLGWLGGKPMPTFLVFIGICEVLIGIGIAVGLFSRLAAIGGAIIMIGAIATVHQLNAFMPATIVTGNELPWLFLASFILIFALGAGKWSLNHVFFKKEML